MLAKVKVVLKRYGQKEKAFYSDGWMEIDFEAKRVIVNKKTVKLTALEFRLLACLVENKGKVVSKQELFEKVWQDKFTGDGTLNVHIRRLRTVIEKNPEHPVYIITVWGDGYKFQGGAE